MQKTRRRGSAVIRMSIAALISGMAAGSVWADDLPNMGEEAAPWKVDVIYENDTHFRGKDHTGKSVGLSKFRNTIQAEADKSMGDGWGFHGVFRGTWDGVYRMNKDHFGTSAGGPITIENTAGPGLPPAPTNAGTPLNLSQVPWGGGVNNPIATALGLPGTNAFGFNNNNPAAANYNPNVGMEVLGASWHNTAGGVAFGVPVRPCDTDRRGCTDFGGYGDLKLSELENPEFNKHFDFIREAYAKKTFALKDGSDLFVKVGRQQIVWGRTDLFRVLDVFNPVDYSRNNIYDELQDIRIPLWSAQAEWRMGGSDTMQDRNLQFVWSFDEFRANNLGQCGQPNVILDAGCFFRGMKNLWDNGGTVANFAGNGTVATDFGIHQIGIRNVHLPKWSEAATLGLKFEGVTQEGLSFSLNAMTYRSQLPSLRAFNSSPELVNPFTGAAGATAKNLIAFDMYFPRINMIGGSLDFQSETLGAAFRFEGALTHGEEFANSARERLFSKNNVFRSVIGIDRPTFIPFINPNRTTLFSAQLFYQHIFNHESYNGPLGKVGMADWENNVTGTLLIKGFMMNDRLSPQLILARDFQARAMVAAPQVEWNVTNDSKLTFGANVKLQDGMGGWGADDCRSCAPYAPFTNTYFGGQQVGQSAGLSGLEPLGRFRAGPIGTAWKQNEVYVSYRMKF